MILLIATQVLAGLLSTSTSVTPAAMPPQQPHIMLIQNRFGGPTYQGAPAVNVTASLYKAGGGAGSFSMVRAFSSMIGDAPMQSELAGLRARYSATDVDQFVQIFDFAMADAWKRMGENNIAVPSNATFEGRVLAQAILTAGQTDSGYLFSGYLFDKLLSFHVNNQINADIDAKVGSAQNTRFHTIASIFFCDVAQTIGDDSVKSPTS
jgi:hypothetical protein